VSVSTLHDLLAPVRTDLDRLEDYLVNEMHPSESFLHEYLDHVAKYRGKRLRPALVFMAARACGDVTDDHLRLAAVAELLHTATLVHDDILDDADIRRRNATAHKLFGSELSVLLGDYLFARAYELACDGSSTDVAVYLAKTARAICVGEMMQIRNRGNLELDEQAYLSIIEQKTACLYSACGYIGVHFAGGSKELTASMTEFGMNLGMAFQIADDLLDLTGDEARVGKTLGTDVANQKLTLPLIHMLEQLPEDRRAAAQAALSNENGAAEWRPLLAETGSMEYARTRADQFIAAARANLDGLNGSSMKAHLDALAGFVLDRDR